MIGIRKETGEVNDVVTEVTTYLCPYCSEAFDSIDALRPHIVAAHQAQPLPAREGVIHLNLNGQAYELYVEPEWTLYYVIHDRLGLTGSKMFCDRGACGSCTVILNGRPVLSCMTLACECDGMRVQTVEGVAAEKHPLVETYVKHHAMQCGYCTPGFIVTAKAFLDDHPKPTEDEIREALAGNLCRCGTYPQHPKAVMEAAERLRKG